MRGNDIDLKAISFHESDFIPGHSNPFHLIVGSSG